MKFISIKDKLPNNDRYRQVMLEDGLHICRYSVKQGTWIDREAWHYGNEVTHWQLLIDETE
jgi:hypothetical protein